MSKGSTGDRHFFPVSREWRIASIMAAIMVLLALLGVGLTTTSRAAAPAYWISLVPVYGVLCMGAAWARARHSDGMRRPAIIRQLLHWTAIGVALSLDFMLRRSGEETAAASGLNAMLLLALGCFLAGVHLEWVFAIVGGLLSLALIIVAKADQYLWLIFVVGVVAFAALVGLRWLFVAKHAHKPE